ncbi:MAG: hypothetical protein H0T91_05405, partial [Propionibacteriaceae bacterium]|nr:hypothetical protein [Propionibacteriaceae bacterium]
MSSATLALVYIEDRAITTEGAAVFSKQLTPLASSTEADAPVRTGLDPTDASADDAQVARDADPSPSQPFTGQLERLDRLATVAAGTIVGVFEKGEPPLLKAPGELLIPSWIPSRGGLAVLPVTTETVTLTVSVAGLVTLDGQDIDRVDVEVRVRLRESAISALATEHGANLGSWLTREVQVGVESSVRAAVGLNREPDLARQSLQRVLSGRW